MTAPEPERNAPPRDPPAEAPGASDTAGPRSAFARDLGKMVFPDMAEERRDLALRIAATYDWTFGLHGAKPRAALWSNRRGQRLRFAQLVKVFDGAVRRGALWRPAQGAVSLNDLGCGYGAFFQWLVARRWLAPDARYTGYDVSERMIDAARRAVRDPRATFYLADAATEEADYGFASGTFGMKLDVPLADWEAHCRALLRQLWGQSRRGMAFNMLNRHARDGRPDDGSLYYAEPEAWAAFAERALGAARVALLTHYTKHDFTVLAWRA